jgi:hypothetical protein
MRHLRARREPIHFASFAMSGDNIDKAAETALRTAARGIINLGGSYSLSALCETMTHEAENCLIAQSGGTLTRAKAEDRVRKAIAAIVTRGLN